MLLNETREKVNKYIKIALNSTQQWRTVMKKNPDPSELFSLKSLTAVFSSICAGVPAAYAQEATQDDTQDAGESLAIEEILVTATKRGALNLQDVPMSITAFTNEDIQAQGFKKLDDYAAQIPSLSFGRREPGGSNVIIRGCAVSAVAFSDNPTTSVYLDEQPIGQQGYNPDPRLVDIERVEALSGPQGTLFGEASQCGTLRIITNKPDSSGFESWVDITGETVDGGDTGHDVSAMVNLPLIEDKLALRLVGFTAEDAGWVDNVLGTSPGGTFDNAAYVADDVNKSETTGARISLRWTPSEDWTFDAQAFFQDTESNGFGDSDLAEGVYADSGLGKWEQLRFNPDTWSDEWYQLALTAEGKLGWADATITAGFAHRETRYQADSTAYVHSFQLINDYWRAYYNPYINNYDFGGDPRAFSIDEQDWDRLSFEARLSSPADSDSRWSWIAGVFYNKLESGPQAFTANVIGLSDNCDVYYLAYAEDCAGQFIYASYLHYYYFGTLDKLSDNWWHGTYETNLEQKAVFGEFTYDVSENLAITLGGRWYDIDTDRITRQGTLIEPLQTTQVNCGTQLNRDAWQINGRPVRGFDTCYSNEFGQNSESGFVPKVNATYQIDDDKLVFFTYSEGFRSGGANPAKPDSVFGTGNLYDNYESDELMNYEIGAKTTWADGRFQLNVTAFHMVWEGIQIEAVDPDAQIFSLGIVNFPEAEIDGFEADFSWIPTSNLKLSGTLAHNDAALSENAILFEDADEPKVATAGTRLPIVPDWKGSLLAEYTFESEIMGAQPYLLGSWTYQGDSVNSLEGIQSIVADVGVRTHASHSIGNLRFGLKGDNWTASLFVDNVTNEYAQLLFNDRWTKTRLTTNRPRTFGINYSYTWN
jgi:outer membrane receptor protein involved in Fe transport